MKRIHKIFSYLDEIEDVDTDDSIVCNLSHRYHTNTDDWSCQTPDLVELSSNAFEQNVELNLRHCRRFLHISRKRLVKNLHQCSNEEKSDMPSN